MKVYVRRWTGLGTYEVVAEVRLGTFEGIAFRNMDEQPATAINFKGLRVTEMYLHASEPNTLNVWVEEVKA